MWERKESSTRDYDWDVWTTYQNVNEWLVRKSKVCTKWKHEHGTIGGDLLGDQRGRICARNLFAEHSGTCRGMSALV